MKKGNEEKNKEDGWVIFSDDPSIIPENVMEGLCLAKEVVDLVKERDKASIH